jgi:hypothetical protein
MSSWIIKNHKKQAINNRIKNNIVSNIIVSNNIVSNNIVSNNIVSNNIISNNIENKTYNKIGYFSSHPGLVNGEIKLLKELGYRIYIPKKDNQLEKDTSVYNNIDIDYNKIVILDNFNPYTDEPTDELIDIITSEFDIIFVTLLSMKLVHKLVKKSNMPIIIRIFGKAGNHNYYDSYKEISEYQNVYFGMGYKEMLEVEPEDSRYKYIYLPLPENYLYESYRNTWQNKTGKIMFVCSYIDESSYYKNIYDNFKSNFGDLPHMIYGRQGIFNGVKSDIGEIVKNDSSIIPNCPIDTYIKAYQDHSVMYYHSTEERHIHYHPIEAIMIGMPVVFLKNSLLDTLTDMNSIGRCSTNLEAKEKIIRLLNGDTSLSQQIISDNSVILSKISKPHFIESFVKLKEKMNIKQNKVCIFLHFGLGDFICMIPAINYLSILYSEIKIVCLEKNINTIKSVFKNNKNITYLIHNKFNTNNLNINNKVPQIYSDIYQVDETKYKDELFGYEILRCGLHKYIYETNNKIKFTDSYSHLEIPFDFYRQLNVPYSIFWTYFMIPELENDYLMDTLNTYLKDNNITSYIFVHNITGVSNTPIINSNWIKTHYSFDPESVLFINPNINMYDSSSKFYNIAENFINKPILDYINILRNANGLYLSNSSFFCLALHLDIKTEHKYVFSRDTSKLDYIWDSKYGYNGNNRFNIIYNITLQAESNNYLKYISGGKLGDLIFQLDVINQNYIKTNKKGILYISNIGDKFSNDIKTTYDDTKKFILDQDYILDYKIHNGEKYDINLSSWRDTIFQKQVNWVELFQETFDIQFGMNKWLNNISKNTYFENNILISHSLIRENTNTNLDDILSKYDSTMLHFICLDVNEIFNFQKKITNKKIKYTHFTNILDMIIAINSCKLFIGNFSAPLCIALSQHKECIGIAPTDTKHNIDLTLINNMSKYWPHFTVIY